MRRIWRSWNVACVALIVLFGAPSVALAESDVGGPMIDRRWDLVVAAIFGLGVSIVGLRRWGYQHASSSGRTSGGGSPKSVSVIGSGAGDGLGSGIARHRERRREASVAGESKGSAVLKLDAGQVDALSARYGAEGAASVLTAIEQRARSHLRGEHDKLVMLGRGDMVIMLEGLTNPLEDAALVAKRLSADARRPVDYQGVLLFPTLSIGIAHSKVPGDIQRLLAEADLALTKTSGPDRIALNNEGQITKS